VSRVQPKDANNHVILGVRTYKLVEFATSTSVDEANVWGIVKALADTCLAFDEGKYVLLKDPNQPIIRVFSVPANTFVPRTEPEADE